MEKKLPLGKRPKRGASHGGLAAAYRRWLRRRKIRARDALGEQAREALSRRAVERILVSEEFRRAKTVLLYRAVRGELRLDGLAAAPEAAGKRLAYPVCLGESEMAAYVPRDGGAWAPGRWGIMEPVPERSEPVAPEDVDLVVCPCTAFDAGGGRMGMGAGYYDRYLVRCVNARVVSAAFECQRAARVPAAPWDRPVEAVFTEAGVYRR